MMKVACLFVVWIAAAAAADDEYLIGIGKDLDAKVFLEAHPELEAVDNNSYPLYEAQVITVKATAESINELVNDTDVKYTDNNSEVSLECLQTVANGVWGLDRIDQRGALGYADPTSIKAYYDSDLSDGTNVHAYILDTGIDIFHAEFGGRATFEYTATGTVGEDKHGHGTHVAGTIGSLSFGVAKNVRLHGVKILNDWGSGSWSGVINGMDWVRRNAIPKKSVVNMSIGGWGKNYAVFDAVRRLVNDGITVVVAAGNSYIDACNYSPAGAPDAITVGATDIRDNTAYFTNYGPCVDIFAPGVAVKSTLPHGDFSVYSGTSMAAPHVTGAVARYMTTKPRSPSKVREWLKSKATEGKIKWYYNYHNTSPNSLLYYKCSKDGGK